MPKKSRRAKAKQRAAVAKAVQEKRSQQAMPLSSDTQPAPRISSKTQDLANRYQYIVPEMKRIGIVAGSIILILVILSFFLG